MAEQRGAAIYTYPIQVPRGRNGMQPSLALRYSSHAPLRGGIAAGWTLDLPSVHVDRSRGEEPGVLSDFRVSLGGVTGRLVPVDDQAPFEDDDETNVMFRTEFDGSFTRWVLRFHFSPIRLDWVALTTDGVKHFFEQDELPSAFTGTGWHITRQIDPFGNTVRYFWEPVTGEHGRIIDVSLDRIEYTSNEEAGLAPHAKVELTHHPELETCFGSQVPIGAAFQNNLGRRELGYFEGARRLSAISVFVRDDQRADWRLSRRVSLEYNLDRLSPLDNICFQIRLRRFDAHMRFLEGIQDSAFDRAGNETRLPPLHFDYARPIRVDLRRETTVPDRGFDHFGTTSGALGTLVDVDGDGVRDRITAGVEDGDCVLRWQKTFFGGGLGRRQPVHTVDNLSDCAVTGGLRVTEQSPRLLLLEQIGLHFLDFTGDGVLDLLTNPWAGTQSLNTSEPLEPATANDLRFAWWVHPNRGLRYSFPVRITSPPGTARRDNFPPALPPPTGEERLSRSLQPQSSIPIFADLDGDRALDFIDVGTHPRLLGNGLWRVSLSRDGGDFAERQPWLLPDVDLATRSGDRGEQQRGFVETREAGRVLTRIVAGLHDINGDGLPDLVVQEANGKLRAYMNYGDGMLRTPLDLGLSAPLEEIQTNFHSPGNVPPDFLRDGDRGYRRRMVDVDGDGLVDMLVFEGPADDITQTSGLPLVHLNMGDRFSPAILMGRHWAGAKRLLHAEDGDWSLRTDFIDGDGDYLRDLVEWSEDGSVTIGSDGERDAALFALTEVSNARGLRIRYRYAPATDPAAVAPHPGARLPRPVWVVTGLTVSGGHGLPDTIETYRYQDPAYLPPSGHRDDPEPEQFLGFGQVTVTRTGAGGEGPVHRARRQYAYDETGHPHGRVVKQWIFQGQDGPPQLHEYTETTWQQEELFDGETFFTHLDTSLRRTCRAGAGVQQCEQQTANVYRTTETWRPSPTPRSPRLYFRRAEQEGSGLRAGESDRRTVYGYQIRYGQDPYRADDYRVLRERATSQALRRNDQGVLRFETTGLTRVHLDDDSGLPVQTDRRLDRLRLAQTKRAFDPATGNLLSVTKPEQAADGGSGRQTRYDYDPHGIFVTRIINELGHVVTKQHDVATGALLERSGPNRVDVPAGDLVEVVVEGETWQVDGFGRVLAHRVSLDDETAGYRLLLVDRRIYFDNESPFRVREERRRDFGSGAWLAVDRTYGGRGRLLAQTQPLDGELDAVTRYEYDTHGNVSRIETPDPRKDDGASVAYTYGYDGLGRLTAFQRPDGSGLAVSYAGLEQTRREVTSDDSGGTRQEIYDVFGRLVEVQELDGTDHPAITRYTYDANDHLATITDAEGNLTRISHNFVGHRTAVERGPDRTWRYEYDLNGNLVAKTEPVPPDAEAGAFTTIFVYDDLDRVVEQFPATRGLAADRLAQLGIGPIVYTYDEGRNGTGRLSHVRLPFGQVTYGYDARGSVSSEVRSFALSGPVAAAAQQTVTRRYNPLRQQTLAVWDDGQQWLTTYDERGLVATVEWFDRQAEGWRTVAAYQRSLAGQPRRRQTSFGQRREYVYDSRGRIGQDTIKLPDISAGPLATRSYDYTEAGDLAAVAGATAGVDASASYTYDPLHRLRTAAGPHGYAGSFTYSRTGNIAAAKVTWDGSPEARDVRYEYGDRDPQAVDRLIDRAAGGAYARFAYDHSGNVISRQTPAGTWRFTWDGDNQLREVQGPRGAERYFYDHTGQRVLAAGEADGVRFWFAESETHYGVDGAQARRYLHLSDGNSVLARVENGRRVELHYADALQNLMLALDETGEVAASFLYGAYGEIVHATGAQDHRRQFNGKETDPVTGLRYYGFRYYDPLALRWNSADPLYHLVPEVGLTRPGRLNLYTFSLNNPVRYYDPDGRKERDPEQDRGEWTCQMGVPLTCTGRTGEKTKPGPGEGEDGAEEPSIITAVAEEHQLAVFELTGKGLNLITFAQTLGKVTVKASAGLVGVGGDMTFTALEGKARLAAENGSLKGEVGIGTGVAQACVKGCFFLCVEGCGSLGPQASIEGSIGAETGFGAGLGVMGFDLKIKTASGQALSYGQGGYDVVTDDQGNVRGYTTLPSNGPREYRVRGGGATHFVPEW